MKDWQLPPGVSRGLWDAAQDDAFARNYDATLAGAPLLDLDIAFVRAHCPTPGRLLDLGAGTGRLAIPLARDGFRVVAVDLSPRMLEVLGEKARRADVSVARLAANIVELDALAGESFDYAACLFSTLGLVEGQGARRQVFKHVRRLLKPGGVFVFHVHNRSFHLWTRFGRRLLLKNWWRSLLGREERGDFVMPPHQGAAALTMHLFTRREIVRLLRQAGLRLVEIRPVSLRRDGRLRCPWLAPGLRSYGWLIVARRGA
ncbi:MAG: methyltransferase domain-containing protein [Gemmataceae bacterium]